MDTSDATGRAAEPPADSSSGSDLAWLRRASGDDALRPWPLTAARLAAYVAAVHSLRNGGAAILEDDPAGALDPDQQPALRPQAWRRGGEPDPVDIVTTALEERPAVAKAIAQAMPVAEFAAAHVRLQACAHALGVLAGADARSWDPDGVRAWLDAQRPTPGAESDFAESLGTAVAGWQTIDAAFGS